MLDRVVGFEEPQKFAGRLKKVIADR